MKQTSGRPVLDAQMARKIDAYWRAANFLSVGQIYLCDMDRFHLVLDTVSRLPQIGSRADHLRQRLQDKLVEHKHYIDKHGEDMPEIRNWSWS